MDLRIDDANYRRLPLSSLIPCFPNSGSSRLISESCLCALTAFEAAGACPTGGSCKRCSCDMIGPLSQQARKIVFAKPSSARN